MPKQPNLQEAPAELRRRAERSAKDRHAAITAPRTEADARRLLHELQVHQIELEMQNAELRITQDKAEDLLAKYTDLYDFAPLGYFTLTAEGKIREANLAGASMLGIERSALLKQRFRFLVVLADRPGFDAFFKRLFASGGHGECAVRVLAEGAKAVDVRIIANVFEAGQACRMAVTDVTEHIRAEAVTAQLATSQMSEQQQSRLLQQSRLQQQQLRELSHQILHAQEEERKRISRELHDVIAQTLVGINMHLAGLAQAGADNPAGFRRQIARTRRMVEKSVDVVHRFARELRPTMLDDLGLIPALQTFMKDFMESTGIRVSLKTFAGIERSPGTVRTVLYRVAQEALTNVARHAKASQVEVRIHCNDDIIRMEIKDNGQGFEMDAANRAKKGGRLGLLGMKERVEMTGGMFRVESTPGHHTTVRVEIPNKKSGRRKIPAGPI